MDLKVIKWHDVDWIHLATDAVTGSYKHGK